MAGLTLNYAVSGRSTRIAGFTAVIAPHGVVVFLLLQLEPLRSAITAAVPIRVSLLSPPKHVEPEVLARPAPRKPRVQPQQPEKSPIMTAFTDAPAPYVAPAPLPEPLPPIEAAPSAPVAVAAAPAPAPVTPPQFNAAYLNSPAPAYPALSRRTSEEGKVVLRVLVNERGVPAELQLRTSSGFSRLDNTALETVRQWKFVPARRGETPIAAWVLVPISFSLRN